jgi:hypothetical protein
LELLKKAGKRSGENDELGRNMNKKEREGGEEGLGTILEEKGQ